MLMERIKVSESCTKDLEKKRYRILGTHGAVEICTWTKKALKREGVCYKQKFYGVDTHRCAQITPLVLWCDQNCIYCWRPMEEMKMARITEENVDDPETLVDDIASKRWNLLNGMPGNAKVDKKLLEEAKVPTHYAISLSGEPTMYPRLGEMVKLIKKMPETRTIFIVTNGQNPKAILKLKNENALPTQLYVSLTAPNKKIFSFVSRSVHPDGWERLIKTLEIFADLPTRRVIRLTLIKGINDSESCIAEFSKLIEMSKADFVEIKAYMHIGYSQHRLEKHNMPSHDYVKKFSMKLLDALPSFEYSDESEPSRIVLLKNKNSRCGNLILPEEK